MPDRILLGLLLLLLLACVATAVRQGDDQPCRLLGSATDGAIVACSPNATSLDLSAWGLTGQVTLTFASSAALNDNATAPKKPLHLDLLDVSGNPGLTAVTIAAAVAEVHVESLDISGTAMAPLPGRLLNPSALQRIRVQVLIANGTAHTEPLDMSQAADLLYRLRVHTFALIGWPLAHGRLPANLTSHRNYCGSKYFKSITVSRSRLLRALDGANGAMLVTDSIDLSGNSLRSVSNVAFSAGRVDLSDNYLVDLSGVVFKPGSYCRSVFTGPPTLLLRRNRLTYAVLDSLAASSSHAGGGFTGVDLSGNEGLLLQDETATQDTSRVTIGVSAFLDLSSLGGHPGGLAALLARFQPMVAGAMAAFRLSLADNWIPDLASAAALVADFAAPRGSNASAVTVHLDLSGNPLLTHLNLSEMPSHLLASLTLRRLPNLRSASVRVRDGADGAGVLERLRRCGQRPDADVLADLWSRRVPLRLDPRPARCCLTDNSDLVCTFGDGSSSAQQDGSIFCYSEHEDAALRRQSTPLTHLPEFPLLFTCVVLGCALLLGLATGVAVFYARRRSRGRYTVHSVYAVRVKNRQQQ